MITPATTAPAAVAARRWPAWYNVVLLCGAAVLISYIDRTNISVASISMQAQFGWTQTAKGWVLSSATSPTMAMFLMCGASGTLALCLSGFAVNSFDIAPRHADVIWGLANTAGTIPGIIGVAVTGWLIDRTGSFNAPFFLTAAVGFVGAVVYFLFASGEREVE